MKMKKRNLVNLTYGAIRQRFRNGAKKADVAAHLSRAQENTRAREWAQASADFRVVLDAEPARAEIWVQLGHALKESGDYQGARIAYERGVELEPDAAETFLHLGHLLKNLGETRDAGLVFAEVLKLAPETHDAFDQLEHLGWSRSDILAAVPALKVDIVVEKDQPAISSLALFEFVRQMTGAGPQTTKISLRAG